MILRGEKMNVLLIIGIVIVMGTMAQIFMKRGMTGIGEIEIKQLFSLEIFKIVFDKFVFTGLALYALSAMLYLVAISMEEVSYVYPLIGLGYILTAIFAWVFFGEKLSTMRILGILLITTGAYFVVMKW
jgi:drug/metabolite transporter (DMT)-like permease